MTDHPVHDLELIEFKNVAPEVASRWSTVASQCRCPERLRNLETNGYTGVIGGWRALTELVKRYEAKHWLFRGQSKRFELRPHIGRENARKNRDGSYRPHCATAERNTLEAFILRSRPYLSQPPEKMLDWMAVARHHGMPTRLLDWSQSLFVAAMFACKNSGVGSKGYEHAEVCAVTGLPDFEGNDPFLAKQLSVYRPPHITSRIPAQQSVFTIHPRPETPLEKEHVELERWLIPSDSCFHLKKMLDVAGINDSTIGPDLDGLGRYLEWCYKWDVPV